MDSFYDFVNKNYSYSSGLDDFGGVSIRYYEDSVFDMKLPIPIEASKLISEQLVTNKTSMRADFVPTYNFYSKYYEKVSQMNTVENSKGTQTYLPPTFFASIYETPFEEDPFNPANPWPANFNPPL